MYIILGILLVIVLWFIFSYNGFVRLINRAKEAWADIDVQLKRRVWRYDFPDKPLTLWGWIAQLPAGQAPHPNELEIEEILWLDQEEGAGHVDGLPTNREFLACLAEAIE